MKVYKYLDKVYYAVLRINPDAKMSIHIEQGETVDNCIIIWREGTDEISRADIKTEMEKA